MNGQSLVKGFIPLPAGARAVYNASGLEYYQHSDWVGSARLASTPSRSIAYDTAYAAFGEPYAVSGVNSAMSEMRFAGHNADMLNQGSEPIYDARYREYSYVQRRWLQPDPSGLAFVNPANPQTWNRYAYVGNNPLNFSDPIGLNHCIGSAATCASPNINGNEPNPMNFGTDFLWGWIPSILPVQEVYFSDTISIIVNPFAYWGVIGVSNYDIPGSYNPSGAYGISQGSTRVKPQMQAPQKKPCTSLANNLQGTPAAGLDTLSDAVTRPTHPLDLLAVNATMFVAAGGRIVAGGLAIGGGCFEPTPFEPLTCIAGSAAGTVSIGSGMASGAFGAYFFKKYTLPAIKDWGCHE